jgi:ribosomal protein S21
MQVLVRDNNIDQALRVLKKKMQREGVFREMKRRRFYERPSEQATRGKSEAARPQVCPQASDPGWTDRRAKEKAGTTSQRCCSAPAARQSSDRPR